MKRYDVEVTAPGEWSRILEVEDPTGPYVRAEDAIDLQLELDALREKHRALAEHCSGLEARAVAAEAHEREWARIANDLQWQMDKMRALVDEAQGQARAAQQDAEEMRVVVEAAERLDAADPNIAPKAFTSARFDLRDALVALQEARKEKP
jgi:hypothetical protein